MPYPKKSPEARDVARKAARTRWLNTSAADREAQMAALRKRKTAKWLAEIDPDGTLDPAERAIVASGARVVDRLRPLEILSRW